MGLLLTGNDTQFTQRGSLSGGVPEPNALDFVYNKALQTAGASTGCVDVNELHLKVAHLGMIPEQFQKAIEKCESHERMQQSRDGGVCSRWRPNAR